MLIEWARREYKKPVVISDKDCVFLNFIKEDYKYIARDKTGLLYAYFSNPKNIKLKVIGMELDFRFMLLILIYL